MVNKTFRHILAHATASISRSVSAFWPERPHLINISPRLARGIMLVVHGNLNVDMFDRNWYKNTYNDVPKYIDLWQYFISTGYRQGHNPNPIFDSAWYREQYLDETQRDINPFMHFLEHGASGNYNPSPLFDARYYLLVNQDVKLAAINPLSHYLSSGAFELRNPSPLFDAAWYIKHNPDAKRTEANPLNHFLLYGANEDRNPNPYFDTAWYRKEYLNNTESSINPLIHYLLIGEKLGYHPSVHFDPEWYLFDNPDLVALDISLLQHFLQFGLAEGRTGTQAPNQYLHVDQIKQAMGSLPASTDTVPASINLKVSSVAAYIESNNNQSNTWLLTHSRSNAIGIQENVSFPGCPYVAILHDVIVLAGTRFVLANNDTILHDEEFAFQVAKDAAVKYNKAWRGLGGMLKLKFSMQQASWVDAGINLMHEYSNNYFHFITETIPRILLIEELDIPLDIPYLFEDSLHVNMRQLITLLNHKKRPVIYLQNDRVYSVASMYLPSDMSSVIDAYNCGTESRETVLETHYIRAGINRCLADLSIVDARQSRKIYASRSSGYRKLLNEADLEARLAGLGFEILKTEGLNIETQARIFRDASIVIGPTGANLTNIVWCNPGTKVVVLASDHPSHQLYFWELLGKVSSCDVTIVQGPRAYNRDDKYSVHDDYYIDVDAVIASISL